MKFAPLRRVRLAGTGSYVPEKRLTNPDLEKLVDTSDEWIVQRTGIRERRIAAPDEATSDMAYEAARRAIDDAGLAPEDIHQIIVGTVTADMAFPSAACLVQHRLGCRHAPAFDLSAACSGFLYGLVVGRTAIASGVADNVIVVGADCLSRITDYTDRNTCVLFGDGAGAVVLSPGEPGADAPGIVDTHWMADGGGAELMMLPGGGSRHPASHATVDARLHYLTLQGRAVFKQAVGRIIQMVEESLARCGLVRDDIDLFIPHQMNVRIIDSAATRLKLPPEKVFVNLDRYGNTSSATIPIAIDEARRSGRIRAGDLVLLVAFGGGLTWASVLYRA